MVKKVKTYNVEFVEWVDSCGNANGWTDVQRLKEGIDILCYSVGLVIDENKNYILLVQNWHPDQTLTYDEASTGFSGCHQMAIPKCSIKKRQVFKRIKRD